MRMPKSVVRIGLVMTHSLGFYREILRGVNKVIAINADQATETEND